MINADFVLRFPLSSSPHMKLCKTNTTIHEITQYYDYTICSALYKVDLQKEIFHGTESKVWYSSVWKY